MNQKIVPKGVESFNLGRYNITNDTAYEIQICYMQEAATGGSLWQINNPMVQYLPRITLQLALMIILTRILMFILQPLRQPRFVAEVTAGIIFGPTLVGEFYIGNLIFPFENNSVLETFANLGLTYHMFLVGLEMDLSALRHTGKKSLTIAIIGILIPLIAGAGLYFVPIRAIKTVNRQSLPIGAAFWAITLSITSFPELARILSDVKLLHTELGRVALTSALINDISAWVLLIGVIIFIDPHRFYMAALPTIIFVLLSWFLLRPGISSLIKQIEKKGHKRFDETHIYFILAGVAICGCITDACGSHSMIGGFTLGLIIPHGEIAVQVMEKIEEFVNGIMLPAFILLNGLRTNLRDIPIKTNWRNLAFVTVTASSVKIISTVIVCSLFGMSSKDAWALGGLLNTKGVLALIVLNEGRSLKVLDSILMLVMVFMTLFMTALVAPIFFFVSKTTKRFRHYKLRNSRRSNSETEHRIIACIHSTQNLSGIISLLQMSCATRRFPICVFAVHLVELTGRASAMLVVHDARKSSTSNNPTREKAESEQIISAFENYESQNDAVVVYPLTAVSPYSTMHEDIIHLAEDEHVALILIPYHKLSTIGGGLRSDNVSIKEVNQNLLVDAPCSVGILVDRGLGLSLYMHSIIQSRPVLHLAMIFIGGPDDHEALSYATRMAGSPNITLAVVRFLPCKDTELDIDAASDEDGILAAITENETAKEFDDEFINEFRFKIMYDKSITYHEKQVTGGEEIMENIGAKYNNFDLYIVGRDYGGKSPLKIALSEWSNSQDLGPIGEALVSTYSTRHASVLVVQQSATAALRYGSQHRKGKFGQKKWVSPVLNPDYEAFVHVKRNS